MTTTTFIFNYLPVNYLEIIDDDLNNENVKVTQKCYMKAGHTSLELQLFFSLQILWTSNKLNYKNDYN